MPVDILLTNGGDILVSETADITLNYSIRQAVKIRLQWFFDEWRFAPEFGLPYFEEVFVKNPVTARIRQIVREEAMKADKVNEVRDISIVTDNLTRIATIKFTIITDYDSCVEEVTITVGLRRNTDRICTETA